MARESGRNMALYVGLSTSSVPILVPYMSSYTIEGSTDKIEVTAGQDGNKTYVPGLPDFSATVEGFADNAVAAASDPLWLAAGDGNPRYFRLYPNLSLGGAAVVATVTNKALTSNVATLTATAHGFLFNQAVTVAISDAVFDGSFIITAVTANTFSYAKTNANVTSAAATGTATGPNSAPHYYGQAYFDRSEAAGVGSARTVSSNMTAAGTIVRTP